MVVLHSVTEYESGNLQGFAKRMELLAAGQQLKAEKLEKLMSLKKEMDENTKLRTDAQMKMDEKANLAEEAKKKHEEAWEGDLVFRIFEQQIYMLFDVELQFILNIEVNLCCHHPVS